MSDRTYNYAATSGDRYWPAAGMCRRRAKSKEEIYRDNAIQIRHSYFPFVDQFTTVQSTPRMYRPNGKLITV